MSTNGYDGKKKTNRVLLKAKPHAAQQRLVHGRRWRGPDLGATFSVYAVPMLVSIFSPASGAGKGGALGGGSESSFGGLEWLRRENDG